MLLSASAARAQKHEVAFTSGGLKVGDQSFELPRPGFIKFKTGFTYEINYARRFFDGRLAALYFEFPFAGTPRTRIETTNALSPNSYSSIYFTPGIKLKLLPGARYSPFAMVGVGIARFKEGNTLENNQPNPDPDSGATGVFDAGVGLDVRLISILSLRGQFRNFYIELPRLNISDLKDRANAKFLSAGLVLRF